MPQAAQTDDLSQYEVKPQSGDDLSQYEVQAAPPKPTFTQKYIEPALVPVGTVVGGLLGSELPVAGNAIGAGLGAAAGEATKQGIERMAGRQKQADVPSMVYQGAGGATAELGGQVLGKGVEAAGSMLGKGAEAVESGTNALKKFYSIGDSGPAFPKSGMHIPDEDPFQLTPYEPPPEPANIGEPITGKQTELPFKATEKNFPNEGNQTPFGTKMNVPDEPVDALANELEKSSGYKPLKPNVPLRQQMNIPDETPTMGDPIKAKYPDPAVRQMVRANGSQIVDAIGNDKPTMKAIHDLTRVDLRQALINAGENMGQTTVSDSKFAGSGGISREEAFNRLLAKGHSPQDIVKLAKTSKPT